MKKHDVPLVRPVNPANLPPELTQNLRSFKTESQDYNIHDLVLAFIGKFGRATGDDLMIYVYQIRNKVCSRGYMHQVVHRLRKDDLIKSVEAKSPHNVHYVLTEKGEDKAPEYMEPIV